MKNSADRTKKECQKKKKTGGVETNDHVAVCPGIQKSSIFPVTCQVLNFQILTQSSWHDAIFWYFCTYKMILLQILNTYFIVSVPKPSTDVIMTLGGGGRLPQFTLHETMGVGVPAASQCIVTLSPSTAENRRTGGAMITGAAKNRRNFKKCSNIA